MQMEPKMKRKRKDCDVAGSPKTIQGRSNISHSTDCSNNVQDVSERSSRAGDDGEMPRKRMRCSNLISSTEHSNVLQRVQRGKKKDSGDATPPERARCSDSNSNTSDPSVILIRVEYSSVQRRKRKASGDDEAPQKKMRCSDSSSSSESCILIENKSSGDDGSDNSQSSSSTSTEEERIFEMSSFVKTSRAEFEEKYTQLGRLGAGGFGSVYEGVRKSDSLPVAIKYVPSGYVTWDQVTHKGKELDIILEVALMLKAAGLPGSVGQSAAVSLLDWYFLDRHLILVMERPSPCMDLDDYVESRGGSLDEQEAKMILKQLVDAAVEMHSKGVFHRDIKLQNVLVRSESDGPRVRIIDFGCGTFAEEKSYQSLCGTPAYFPPEWSDHQTYWERPTTVWQLGAIFYSLLSGHEPFTTVDFILNHIQINSALSSDVQSLLRMCLARDPMDRISLEELQRNPALR